MGTPYEGGIFQIQLYYFNSYEWASIRFKTKIYHPNIDEKGFLRYPYRHFSGFRSMLLGIKKILEEPDCSKKSDPIIGKQFIEDRDEFNRIAKEWVQKYAVN